MSELDTNVVQPNVDTTSAAPVAAPVAAPAVQNGNGAINPDDYDFRINDNGDIEISDDFFGLDDNGQQSEPNQGANNSPAPEVNPVNQQPSVQPTQPQYYTEEEVANIGIEKLDPNRIPPTLVPFYKSMQADYTRKTQAVAQEKKDLESRLTMMNSQGVQNPLNATNPNSMFAQNPVQNNVQQAPAQNPPVPPQNPDSVYYKQLYDVAIKNVEKKLGTEFNELDPLHLTALSSEVSQIQSQVEKTHARKQELDNVVSKYVSDPKWSELQTYVDKVLDSMPYNESKQIRDRIESGDVQYIDGFLKTARECFYETNGGTVVPKPPQQPLVQQPVKPVVQPPVLEGGGVGTSASPSQSRVDLSKLGSMSNDDLANLFVDMGFTK